MKSRKIKSVFLQFLFICIFSSFILNLQCKQRKISYSSCINCHSEIHIQDKNHKNINCISCHRGDNTQKEKIPAHKNMLKIPGNLHNADKSCALCHPSETNRIKHSLMTTNTGLIKVNREVFNEYKGHPNWKSIDYHSKASDSYFSQLCANCHLAKEKKTSGAWNGYEKGGGCLACHLNYKSGEKKLSHTSFTKTPEDNKCFNCHSRSGRISLNYRGLQERTSPDKFQKKVKLPDGRTVYQVPDDIHHRAGMMCTDCHSSKGIMGDGKDYVHEEEAVKISCEDCHIKKMLQTKNKKSLKEWNNFFKKQTKENDKKIKYLTLSKNGEKLSHIFKYKDSPLFIRLKKNNKLLQIPFVSKNFAHGKEHQNLHCNACHSTWAPQCIGCHLSYFPNQKGYNHLSGKKEQGRWQEEFGEFFADLPTLGRLANGTIKPFIPGMKLTIDTSKFYHQNKKLINKNLFAPASPHTTGKSRSCESCHLSSLALGYGRGELEYKNGKWIFHNEYQKEKNGPNKGIALDGWIAPLSHLQKDKAYSTRKGARPLNYITQKKVLKVGFCLQCHKGSSAIFTNFKQKRNYKHKNNIYK